MAKIFIAKYPPRNPNLTPERNTPSQLEPLSEKHGVHSVEKSPATWAKLTNNTLDYNQIRERKLLYLWVIINTEPYVRCINEYNPLALTKERTRVCHTNLTGGAPACAGGELFFLEQSVLYINGASGRYPVTSNEQLQEVARVFARMGYRVGSVGFSPDTGKPRRCFRASNVEWFGPDTLGES